MTKILYVDDDAIARRSMAARGFWKENGWELIYTAKDAIDALEFIKQQQPDIMICDIKMPVMDGIQMADVAKNYYPEIKLIFLSGHQDFEYAKQALKLNAIDYLTKPVDEAQLIQVIKSAESAYQKDIQEGKILNEKYPTVKKRYLTKLMLDDFKEMDEIIQEVFDLKLENGFCVVGFIDITPTSEAEVIFIASELKTLCNKLSEIYPGSAFSGLDNNQIFFIFTVSNINSPDGLNREKQRMETTAQELFSKLCTVPTSTTFHYGSIVSSLNLLHSSYQELMQEVNSETHLLLKKVKRYIHDNYFEPDLTLTKIASSFGVNHCYLTSIFKEQFGVNLYDYLIQTRMKKAGELAKTTDKKIYEIAEAVGYKNSQYFSVSFKKYYGVTVSKFKNQ